MGRLLSVKVVSQVDFSDLLLKKFEDGGRGPDGFDCYGLVIEGFKRYGISIPKDYYACALDNLAINNQYEKSLPEWIKLEEPEIPCLITFKILSPYVNHVGLYIGEGRFIHSLQGVNISISSLNHINFKNRVDGYFKYKGGE